MRGVRTIRSIGNGSSIAELIRTSVDARDVLVGVQDLSEREIDRLEAEEEADARREDQDRAPRA